MALDPATIWGAKSTASNNNGGGWNDRGGASTDYSEDDAPALNRSNLSISGATLTDDDAGGLFTTAMVGSIINIVTVGRREIIAWTDGDNVTLDLAPGDGGGLTGYVGGAVADPEQIDSVVVKGNIVHVKAGTYTSVGTTTFPDGDAAIRSMIIGYKTARGDEPVEDDRPLLACVAQAWNLGAYNRIMHCRMTTTNSNGLYVMMHGEAINVKVVNTGGLATDRAFRTEMSKLIDCEAVCANGRAIWLSSGRCIVTHCKIHDSNEGVYCYTNADYSVIEFNIIKDSAGAGIFADGCLGMTIEYNTIEANDKGIDTDAPVDWLVQNNQITHNTTFGATADTASPSNLFDKNNWHGNVGGDVNNFTKGSNATADDPDYTGPDDMSGVDDAYARTIRLGVG